jgi:hypothetical protein
MTVTYSALRRGRGRPRSEASEYVRFLLRLPEDLMEFLKNAADAEFRPANSEIVKILDDFRKAHEAHDPRPPGRPAPRRRGASASHGA